MVTPITPASGYAFKQRTTGNVSLMLFLGTSDSIDNYEEISEDEYNKILAERRSKESMQCLIV